MSCEIPQIFVFNPNLLILLLKGRKADFTEMALVFNLETARKILIDILKNIAQPDNSRRLSEAKCKLSQKAREKGIFLSISGCIDVHLKLSNFIVFVNSC